MSLNVTWFTPLDLIMPSHHDPGRQHQATVSKKQCSNLFFVINHLDYLKLTLESVDRLKYDLSPGSIPLVAKQTFWAELLFWGSLQFFSNLKNWKRTMFSGSHETVSYAFSQSWSLGRKLLWASWMSTAHRKLKCFPEKFRSISCSNFICRHILMEDFKFHVNNS